MPEFKKPAKYASHAEVLDRVSFNNPNDTCVTPHYFWRDEVKVGASWVCDECGQKWVFAFGVSPDNGQPLYTPGS